MVAPAVPECVHPPRVSQLTLLLICHVNPQDYRGDPPRIRRCSYRVPHLPARTRPPRSCPPSKAAHSKFWKTRRPRAHSLLVGDVPLTLYQIGVYHHVTGVDASSSASLAAYINTLTYKEHGQAQTAKIVEGVYWYGNARLHAGWEAS